jgi:hypothetical protein
VQGWLRRSQVTKTLAELGSGRLPVSHDSLDRLEPGKVLEHLRAMLVATGVLPARDEQMARLERWVNTAIAGRDHPDQAEILRRYGAGMSCAGCGDACVAGTRPTAKPSSSNVTSEPPSP